MIIIAINFILNLKLVFLFSLFKIMENIIQNIKEVNEKLEQ